MRRTRGEPELPSPPVRHVLVVCLGNICRSPFAERLLARERPGLVVRSAGFEARDGDPAERNAIEVAREFGIDLRDHAARRLSERDLVWADLVIGMTGRHQGMLRDRWPAYAGKLRLLGDFLEAPPHGLEDPWGETPEVFRAVYGRIEAAAARLAHRLPARSDGSPEGPGRPSGDPD